jgi:hypothetical protein
VKPTLVPVARWLVPDQGSSLVAAGLGPLTPAVLTFDQRASSKETIPTPGMTMSACPVSCRLSVLPTNGAGWAMALTILATLRRTRGSRILKKSRTK